MTTANPHAYPHTGWQHAAGGQTSPGSGWNANNASGPSGAAPWHASGWNAPPFWYPAGLSRPAAIAFTIIGFALWWPVGLAMLIYTIGSRRMGCFGYSRDEYRARKDAWRAHKAAWKSFMRGDAPPAAAPSTSGNHAFDEYRAETLRRLEEEQTEFTSFLERLRFAKDKAEFDQFMAERRQPPRPPAPPQEPPFA